MMKHQCSNTPEVTSFVFIDFEMGLIVNLWLTAYPHLIDVNKIRIKHCASLIDFFSASPSHIIEQIEQNRELKILTKSGLFLSSFLRIKCEISMCFVEMITISSSTKPNLS